MLKIFLLYWRTCRFLKLSQIIRRFSFKLCKPRFISQVELSRSKVEKRWTDSVEQPSTLIDEGYFFIHGKGADIRTIGWQFEKFGKLWAYHQHYFDDLNARNFSERSKWHLWLIDSWIQNNRSRNGVGWEPYVVSKRIVNWIKWEFNTANLPDHAVHSLAIQARWLQRRLEYHLLGNHLLMNAKALIFAGFFFEGDEAAAWLKTGFKILHSEINEQILEDGGHFELSPMYHAAICEDILDILNIVRVYGDSSKGLAEICDLSVLEQTAQKMVFWLRVMSHPDENLSFFNDANFNSAPRVPLLMCYSIRLGLKELKFSDGRSYHLMNSGYVRLADNTAMALLDIGPIGPDYQPGHAHADTLSFEMSIFGQRLFINSGVSTYENDHLRLVQRKTLSHNTVEVMGEDSSEVWSSFRVARRAKTSLEEIKLTPSGGRIACSHDGYFRLRPGLRHCRTFDFGDNIFSVSDTVSIPENHAVARFYIHPHVNVNWDEHLSCFVASIMGSCLAHIYIKSGRAKLVRSHFYPSFGSCVENQCIEVKLILGMSKVDVLWNSKLGREL